MADQPIRFTPAAVTHFESQLAGRDDAWGISIDIRRTGCSGFAYVVEFFDGISCQAANTKRPYNINGINVAMSENVTLLLAGTEIDYIITGLNQGLIFNNPQADSVCGCGQSFTTSNGIY